MADQAGTLEQLALRLGRAVEQLGTALDDDHVLETFALLGVRFPAGFLTAPGITPARATAVGAAGALKAATIELENAIKVGAPSAIVVAGGTLLAAVAGTVTALEAFGSQIRQHGATLPGIGQPQVDELVDGLRRALFDQIFVASIDHASPGASAMALLAGLVDRVDHAGDPANPTRPAYEAVRLDVGRLLAFLADPAGNLRSRYGWGDPASDGLALLNGLRDALALLGLPASVTTEGLLGVPRLRSLGFEIIPSGGGVEIVLVDAVSDHVEATFPLGEPGWQARVLVEWESGAGTSIQVRSPLTISGAPKARAEVVLSGTPPEPIVLIGQTGGSRLEIAGVELSAGIELGGEGAVPVLGGRLVGGKLVIDTSQADGFIAKILAGLRLEAGFGAEFELDPERGLQFLGTGGLEILLPVHVELGPAAIRALHIAASIADGKVPLELSADLSAALGPIEATVEQVGLEIELSFPDGGGNVGPAQLDFGFKPPKGVGLSVDAGIVSGGGYLYFDPDRGEYAGALELEFAGLVELKAIGLITTRMPDGSDGFSLLIVIATEFGGGGIQLGFGFTLLGVGGVLGLNRRMDFAALLDGVVSGGIESVMFPKDVIANAPRIISDLRRFFPPEEGRFLIGPMAKIGWGTPALVTVSLGVIVEIPPGNIAILGVLKCVLPSEDVALLKLQVNFIGALEVDKSRLWFYAQLFDSRILTMTIEGGMGLLVDWSDNPDFVLSVGGFHPSFKPPPLPFPVPPRLSIDILNSPGRLIRVSGYFAVTSNTAQFGAKAELRLGFGGFGIEGHLAFDALFRFSPFSFVIQISAGVSLKAFGVGVFGIDLDFQLEGPSLWRAHGRGSISLLFFEISADFDISWGEERDTALPPVEVIGLLENEIRKIEGWRTRLPAGGFNPLVTLRQLPGTDDLVLHPLGSLFIHQRAIPLDVRIDRVGAQRPSDGKRFKIEPMPHKGLERVSSTGDKFAMGQFQDSNDAEKLSRAAYEEQNAGLELTAEKGAIASPRVVRRSARYELYIVDNEPPETVTTLGMRRRRVGMAMKAPAKPKLYSPPPSVFGTLLDGSSTARSSLSQHETRLRQPFAPSETVRVTGDTFIVAYRRNNVQAFPPAKTGSTTASFRSEASAADAMASWIAAEPNLAGQVHLLRRTEGAGGAVAEPGTWSALDMPSPVSATDAVRLVSGKVLIAGGADAYGKPVTTTSLFDPVAVGWETGAGSLKTARLRHGTARLADGRVVASGGLDADGMPLSSAEVFDPLAKSWQDTGTLNTARGGHTATPIGTRLLVVGGTSDRGAALASAESLDPRTLQWTPVAAMTDARTGHQAVVLTDKETKKATGVLVIGGATTTGEGERALATCEIYDLATGTWLPAGSLAVPRKGHSAAVLPDGRVLVTGGDAVGELPYHPGSLASAEIFDPVSKTWSPAGRLPGGGRSGHRCLATPVGAVVAGGVGRPQATAGFRSTVAFNPDSGTWTETGVLAGGRWDFPAVALADGRVFAVAGLARTGAGAPGPEPAELNGKAEIYLP
ncbi:DUF6603 domain-containing protein [Amycolatopsis orientalis]|uniref:DUF6603 domain-containing protein n=1 Tax=Amycolatopsis orientalis TaxID=31958 RepID=UPI0004239F23|nr:DUF6603 domain-containing protein [Amycolatopsis orientalis]